MYYVVRGIKLITQDMRMSCWYASAQMLIQWRRETTNMTETIHPDPSELLLSKFLYVADNGITNPQIAGFAARHGLRMVKPMSLQPEAIRDLLQRHGPLWVNGKEHITVIAGIRDTQGSLEVLVFDPSPKYAAWTSGQWRAMREWYVLDSHSGRDTASDVETVFLYLP